MDVGALLRASRAAAGLTQAQVARRAATSQSAVARYESGAASPSVRTLDRLLRACGATLRLDVVAAPGADLSGARFALLRRHRREILRRARHHGATGVRVFGSVARGEDGPDSDIDLLVESDVTTSGVGPMIELRDELTALLGQPVDVAPAALLAPDVRSQAEAEAIPL